MPDWMAFVKGSMNWGLWRQEAFPEAGSFNSHAAGFALHRGTPEEEPTGGLGLLDPSAEVLDDGAVGRVPERARDKLLRLAKQVTGCDALYRLVRKLAGFRNRAPLPAPHASLEPLGANAADEVSSEGKETAPDGAPSNNSCTGHERKPTDLR
jgi:hypothetical protein